MFSFKKIDRNYDDDNFLKNINLPILILNKNYHDLFEFLEKSEKIIHLETKLNNLLKEQGQLNYDLKNYQNIKKDKLSKILELTSDVFDKYSRHARKEMKKSEDYILKINNKLIAGEIRLGEITFELDNTNAELLDECVKIYYKSMYESQKRLDIVNQQIEKIRTLLKTKLDEKSTHDEKLEKTYTLLHKIVGASIINKLDEENNVIRNKEE